MKTHTQEKKLSTQRTKLYLSSILILKLNIAKCSL